MYQLILSLHSITRWLVLIGLIVAIYKSYSGWIKKSPFTKSDKAIRRVSASLLHLQFLLGIILYFVSPLTGYLMSHFGIAVKNPVIEFFGMSHTAGMFVSVVLVSIGTRRSQKAPTDTQMFSRMAIFYSIGLLIILIMIPWPFSPFAQRPLLYLP